jgi:hypothetical protein
MKIMRAAQLLGLAMAAAVGVGFAACSGGETSGASPTTTGSTTTQGGHGGATTTSSSGGGGSAPLTCSVAYTNITDGVCDLLSQNCEPGRVCGVATMGGVKTICRSSSGGLKDKGMACQGDAECKDGLFCYVSRCSPYCCPATDEPCGGGTCDINVSFGSGKYAMACSYSQACVLFQGQCPDGEDCHISNAQQGLAVCEVPSDSYVAEGEVCLYRNDCGDAQQCNKAPPDLGDGDTGRCRYNCLVDSWQGLTPGLGGCPATQTCTSLGASQLPNIGLCTLA